MQYQDVGEARQGPYRDEGNAAGVEVGDWYDVDIGPRAGDDFADIGPRAGDDFADDEATP